MIDQIQALLEQYRSWLKEKTTLRQVDHEWVEITTPYLDRHNDYIQIYVRKNNGGFQLTDDGYTIGDLIQSGCKFDSSNRQELLKMTLAGFGIQNHDGQLEVRASQENFALRKHNLLQSMLAVNDLFYLAAPMVKSLFWEDVVAWLDLNDIRYTPKVKFTGKSGFDHLFDFVIPKSRKQPERIVQAINRPSRDTAEAVAFSWIDTREVRSPESRAYALLNDQDQKVSSSVIEALRNYELKPIAWSQREAITQELAA
jgi:hypothetical protein